jgi:deazaflavin-dependent oxidoreductase (nitroreductase family)
VSFFFWVLRVLGRFRVVRRSVRGHVVLYRLTGGRVGGSFGGAPILLLTTVGRKTEKRWTTPLIYLADGAEFVVVAGGRGVVRPSWYYNLRDDPEVTIQVRRRVLRVRAGTVEPERRKELWARLTAIFPAYEDHQRTAGREFPVVAFAPTGPQQHGPPVSTG